MILLGILIGIVASQLIRRRLWRRRCGGGHGPRHMFWKLRRLGLDRDQLDQVEQLWRDTGEPLRAVRFGRWRLLHEVMDLAQADTLDRARLDELATKWTDMHAQAAKAAVDAVVRIHDILRPEQREKLRNFVSYGPFGGPYR
ncbi:MAG TPA: periplasmic heavy metal sensor [Haliangiales bacterium]|nr:periplasmic heavy metal sensor [Haliangiales bacterium]